MKMKKLIFFIAFSINVNAIMYACSINSTFDKGSFRNVSLKSTCQKYLISGYTFEKNDTLYITSFDQIGRVIVSPLFVLNKNPYLGNDSKFQFSIGTHINGDTIKTIYYSKNISVFKIGGDMFYIFQNYYNSCMVHEIIPNFHVDCTKKNAESVLVFSVVTFVYSKRKGIIGYIVVGDHDFGVLPFLKNVE